MTDHSEDARVCSEEEWANKQDRNFCEVRAGD